LPHVTARRIAPPGASRRFNLLKRLGANPGVQLRPISLGDRDESSENSGPIADRRRRRPGKGWPLRIPQAMLIFSHDAMSRKIINA
jgi:hypothetical protein